MLAGDSQLRFIKKRGLGAGRCRRRCLTRAQAGEVEGVRKDHLYSGRPIRAIEANPRKTAVELPVGVGAAAPREQAGLEVNPREVGPRQDVFLCPGDVDRRLVDLRERMRHRAGGARIGRWETVQQRRRVHCDGAGGDAQHARECNLRQHHGLLRLNQARLGRRALGVHARRLSSRPKLVVDERVHGAG